MAEALAGGALESFPQSAPLVLDLLGGLLPSVGGREVGVPLRHEAVVRVALVRVRVKVGVGVRA